MDFHLLLKTCDETSAINIVKNFLIVLKKLATDTIKTASKRASQKTTEATGDLIGNKIAGKITSVSKKSRKELQNDEMEAPKKDIYLKKKEKMN